MTFDYFQLLPDVSVLEQLLKIFSVTNWKHNQMFTIQNKQLIINSFQHIRPLLSKYYRSYKLNTMYDRLTMNRCITILRHCLSVQNFKLIKQKDVYVFKDLHYLRQQQRVTIVFD